ncbi:META domain-containing protein [Streptomyces sp. TRM68367]|uniref:META domain-containing protein n=1 Tax=Streptomyces sp. TRM68367 TaxID=2758415 RepID=UPI00165B85ED|nr:META domain-containing protein [Streptomyces sp. TRM68367]MBC9730369.1 META domain-containing protein [Streptomyces sp. TRM68367]
MYRQKQRMTLTAALVLVPLAAACGSEKADSGSGSVGAGKPLTGVRWSVDSVTVGGSTHRAPADAHMKIDGSRAEGSYGCNTFGATAVVDGDRIRLDKTMSTEMACEKEPMAFEKTLASALTDGSLKAEVKDGHLTLSTDDGDTVKLSEAKDAPLQGTKWNVTSLSAADGKAQLTFDTKRGTVSGSLGCNHVNAKATVRDGHITLGAPSTTRMMCEDSLMNAEKTLLRLFDGQLRYGVDHRTLTLTSENGISVRAEAGK